ncbi:MAG: Crp/Fnr family transcriptional regulator [Firmicutes bacterium]|nr:Crp/Fnr family transcriptional regulator [Bacillota bacterium]
MEKKYEIIRKCPLFTHIKDEDLIKVQNCMGGRIVKFSKNQPILEEGDPARNMCIVVSGAVQMVRDDYNGNRIIIKRVGPGELFAESVSITEDAHMPVTIVAENDCEVLMLDSSRILAPCYKNCYFHINIIKNLLDIIARKNIWLTQRIEITSRRTTRGKIMAYLLMEAKHLGTKEFTIPFNRQELADFLGVERSAMSAEISRLRADGIIECDRSWFRII